jgi:hypothetical protein
VALKKMLSTVLKDIEETIEELDPYKRDALQKTHWCNSIPSSMW